MSRLASWFNIGWNNISYFKCIDGVKREGEGTTLRVLTSDRIAGNGGTEGEELLQEALLLPSKDWFNAPEWLAPENQTPEYQKKIGTVDGAAKVNDKYLQTSYKLTPVLDPYASKVDLTETVDGWFVPSMPDLNQRNPHVIKYLIQNSERLA